ncbi:Uncharacterised protein [Escherichia coli]|uniref:Uncharacterized protein n=1 Tax=Escherichia coli TaxID=562 RepID=A0A376LP55_ECOLX|nr:Uncharacterised protein [Escherichia coli]
MAKGPNLTTEIVNVEHQFLRQRFFITPDNPGRSPAEPDRIYGLKH